VKLALRVLRVLLDLRGNKVYRESRASKASRERLALQVPLVKA